MDEEKLRDDNDITSAAQDLAEIVHNGLASMLCEEEFHQLH